MHLTTYIPDKDKEMTKAVIRHCQNMDCSLSSRIIRMIKDIYTKEVKNA